MRSICMANYPMITFNQKRLLISQPFLKQNHWLVPVKPCRAQPDITCFYAKKYTLNTVKGKIDQNIKNWIQKKF